MDFKGSKNLAEASCRPLAVSSIFRSVEAARVEESWRDTVGYSSNAGRPGFSWPPASEILEPDI